MNCVTKIDDFKEQVWQANKDASPFLCCFIVFILVIMVIMVVAVIVVAVVRCT